ncbi:phosphate transport system regulatory protein PhoU, partial [Mycobacterium avium subsp. hominissuis]
MRSGFHRRLCLLNARLAEMCAMAADAIAQATHALLDADLLTAEGVITRQHSIAALGLQAEETAFALLALQ